MQPGDQVVSWPASPIDLAFDSTAGAGSDKPFCSEIGRSLLRCQFEFSSWVLRRVEKVQFSDEHRVSRRISIEFQVPPYAPTMHYPFAPGEPVRTFWLVPITVMRRRTLVNLDIRDQNDRSVSMFGLRFTQGLDIAMLRAAALLAQPPRGQGPGLPGDLETFIDKVIAGTWADVDGSLTEREGLRERYDDSYFAEAAFVAALERMWHNFTLYTLIPVEGGRHQRLRLAFDEPVDWTYQRSSLERRTVVDDPAAPDPAAPDPAAPAATAATAADDGAALRYRPFSERRPFSGETWARLGIAPTRIRFLTPSAENCMSYHFEFTAPPGLRIAKSRLLAGRPNLQDTARPMAIDCDDEGGRVAGLRAVGISNGSLSRVQVELRVERPGWLATLAASCLVAFVAIGAVAIHYANGPPKKGDDLYSLFTLLLAISGGGATFVAHHSASAVTTKMLTWLRIAGGLGVAMPALVGILLILFAIDPDLRPPDFVGTVLGAFGVDEFDPGWKLRTYGPLTLSGLIVAVVVFAWWAGGAGHFARYRPLSPWKMTGIDTQNRAEHLDTVAWEDARLRPRWWRRFHPWRAVTWTVRLVARIVPDQLRFWARPRRPILSGTSDLTSDFLWTERKLKFHTWAVGVPSAEGWHETFGWTDGLQKVVVDKLESGHTGCTCGLVHPAP